MHSDMLHCLRRYLQDHHNPITVFSNILVASVPRPIISDSNLTISNQPTKSVSRVYQSVTIAPTPVPVELDVNILKSLNPWVHTLFQRVHRVVFPDVSCRNVNR